MSSGREERSGAWGPRLSEPFGWGFSSVSWRAESCGYIYLALTVFVWKLVGSNHFKVQTNNFVPILMLLHQFIISSFLLDELCESELLHTK